MTALSETKKSITIEGDNIFDIVSFYQEINRVFMSNEDWDLGHSLDALNDLLYGGFGEIKGKEPILLIWKNIEKSEAALGIAATKIFYEEKLAMPAVYNAAWAREKLAALNNEGAETYFKIILDIIADHPNIELQRR